jgi:uncharacterized protein YbjT (DUF2867 family)
MKRPLIFVTGAGGMVGQEVLQSLVGHGYRLRALVRSPKSAEAFPRAVEVVVGDLGDPASYSAALNGVETVVHLAALTGKAAAAEFRRINTEATAGLIAASEASGVRNFLFVSSIAAGYAKQRFYPYAQSKLAAERLVRAASLKSTILRPTVIVSAAAPNWQTLRKIALLPVVPMPGGGGVMFQPVAVADVARGIATVLEAGRFEGETFDIGGAEAITLRSFLSQVHARVKGAPARFLPVPLEPIRWALAAVEPVARRFLPATAGQLSLFGNDSAATPNWLMDQLVDGLPTNAALINDLVGGLDQKPGGPDAAPDVLAAECDVFARQIVGRPASDSVKKAYRQALRVTGMADAPTRPFEAFSLALARKGKVFAGWVDSYSALLHRRGSVRRRMIVLAAILENTPDGGGAFDSPASVGKVPALARLALAGATGCGSLALALVILVPTRLVLALTGRRARP